MNWALEALELEPDADERAIKRAYARLLRSNRPDDDPEAFQRLHEAYQTALQWQRYRQEEAEDQELDLGHDSITWTLQPTAPPEAEVSSFARHVDPPESTPAQRQQADAPPAFEYASSVETAQIAPSSTLDIETRGVPTQPTDIGSLVERIVDAARGLTPDAFNDWLLACPELWSLSTKSETGDALLGRLWNGSDSINGANFDLIATTFGWDEIGTHVDPDTLRTMATAMHQRSIWQAGNEAALAFQLQTDEDKPATLPEATLCRRLLTRPWRHMQALISAANPSRLHMMRSALRHVRGDGAQLPCPPLCEEQVRFWREVTAEDKLTSDRALLGLVRGGVLAMLWLLLPLTAYLMKANDDLKAGYGWPSPSDLLPLSITGTVIMLLLGMGLLPWALLLRWLLTPAPMRFLLASIAVVAMLLETTEFPVAGRMLGGATLWLAVRRIAFTSPQLDRLSPFLAMGLFIAAPLVISNTQLPYAVLSGLLTLALCVFDLGRSHRRRPLTSS